MVSLRSCSAVWLAGVTTVGWRGQVTAQGMARQASTGGCVPANTLKRPVTGHCRRCPSGWMILDCACFELADSWQRSPGPGAWSSTRSAWCPMCRFIPRGDRLLGRAPLLPDPDRRTRLDAAVSAGVPAGTGGAIYAAAGSRNRSRCASTRAACESRSGVVARVSRRLPRELRSCATGSACVPCR